MIPRVLSTLVLWSATIVVLFLFGPIAGLLLIVSLSILAQSEFYALLEKSGRPGYVHSGAALGTFLILVSYFGTFQFFIILSLVFLASTALAEFSRSSITRKVAVTLFGILCIPFALSFIVLTLNLTSDRKEGLLLAVWLILTAKFTDVGGLLVGKAIGRRKLAPKTSPNKTWEGAIGGIVISGLAGAAYALAFKNHLPQLFSPASAVLLAFPIAATAVVSDLVQSHLKRLAHQKDSGTIIPGIGGALDLADSLLISAPCGYVLIRVFLLS